MIRAAHPWKWRLIRTWLWWRHTHTFQFAHRPLCSRFEKGAFRIGRVRVCRGCTLLCAGVAAALTAVLLAPLSTPATAYIGYGSSLPVLACTWPAWYARMPRLARDALRFALGACIVLLVSMLWQGPVLLGVANVAALAIIRHVMLRRRAAVKSRGCEGCPERAEYGVCPGFADQAAHIRQFEQAATDRLMQLAVPPNPAPDAAPHRQS